MDEKNFNAFRDCYTGYIRAAKFLLIGAALIAISAGISFSNDRTSAGMYQGLVSLGMLFGAQIYRSAAIKMSRLSDTIAERNKGRDG